MPSPKLYDYNSSFSLLRTNPALTGNVKITVDSAGSVWLNTFDSDEILSGQKYKKYQVTGKKSYAEDLFILFGQGEVAPSVIFKVAQTTQGATQSLSDYGQQYDFFYSSGAQTLVDRNYTEDFSYFAPIWVKSEIPDFFVIFKVPGPIPYKYSENQNVIQGGLRYKVIKKYGSDTFTIYYGFDDIGQPQLYEDGDIFTGNGVEENYTIISGEGSVCIFSEIENYKKVEDSESYFTEKILPNSQVIKTYDLRSGTKIGDYIRQIFSSLGDSFSPISINFGENAYSYFNGISIPTGTYTSAGEFLKPFFTSPDSTSQIDLERYITDGFSRNGIACPNLLNLEFLFDDPNADDYSINRYFGAYVSRNDTGEFVLNGDFLYNFRNSENNENYPKPIRNSFGYYYNNTYYPQSATGGVRIYYESANGFVPGSNDTNSSQSLKLFYITDKNDNFYSLKRVEDWTPSVGIQSPYGYGPYDYSTGIFGTIGSTGSTAGTLVIQNQYVDLKDFTGIDEKIATVKGSINGQNGRSYVDIEFLKNWDIINKDLVFKIYWPLGSRHDGAERYDLIKSGDFSGTILWVPGSFYSSGNNYYMNASYGDSKDVALSFSGLIYDISDIVWDSAVNGSTSVIRSKSPGTAGNFNYYISVFDDYENFESRYLKNWSPSSSYSAGSIVKYSGNYYNCISYVSPSPSSSNQNPKSSTNWEIYKTFTSPGYLKIKGIDAYDASGVSYFQGGTNNPTTRVIFSSDLTDIVSPGNWIQTDEGFSLIKEVGRYVDSPSYNTDTGLVEGFSNFTVYSVAVISDKYQKISLGSDSRFNVYTNTKLKSGVFSFFDFKDFDFDFWESNYGINPNYETFRYFEIQPNHENSILENVPYFVKQGSVSYNGTIYNQYGVFIGVSGSSYFTVSQSSYSVPVVFPLQFSNANYGTYDATVSYETDLDDFDGFIGIRSIEKFKAPPSNSTKTEIFEYGLLSSEYSYLQENYTPERANISRIVPYITKWGYLNGTDSRGNPYRLNASPAFSPSNFSPTFQNIDPDPKYLTHEWFLLESVPRQFPIEFMQDQKSYLGSKINLSLAESCDPSDISYLSSYFTAAPSDYAAENYDYRAWTKEMFSEFTYNSTSGFYETVFKGAKVILKKKSDFKISELDQEIETNVSGYRGYEGYRYSAVLRVFPEDPDTIQAPVKYRFIENNAQQFIVFLVDVVMNDYKLQALGYTGGTGGSPVIDYTLLYSLSDKNYLNEGLSLGSKLYSIDDIKLSCALDLSVTSVSVVNTIQDTGRIFIDPNPDYDTDLREEINLFFTPSTSLSPIGYTGEGSFIVPDISSTYPWPIGIGDTFVDFSRIDSNYYFDIPFSFTSPNTVPAGSIYNYRNKPVFQIEGGGDYFDFILKRTSFSYVSSRVNLSDSYISYDSYFYDETSGSTYSKENDFVVNFEEPSLVVKPGSSFPVKLYSKQSGNPGGLIEGDERALSISGPATQSPQQPIGYEIEYSPSGIRSDLLRFSGKYEPIFNKIIFFGSDKNDTIPGTGIDLSFRNCTFNPSAYYFGKLRNINYTKIASTNILNLSQNISPGPVYPLIGQTPIDRKDFNVFQSSWDPGYYDKYLSPDQKIPVAGTRSMLEKKSLLGSKMMKTPKNIAVNNQIVLGISSTQGIIDILQINSQAAEYLYPIQSINYTNSGSGIGILTRYRTSESLGSLNLGVFPNVEIFWESKTEDTISGVIRLDRILKRYILNEGAGNVFFDNIISEFGVGDPASLEDDVVRYIELNILPIFEGSSLQMYVKKEANSVEDPLYTVRGDIASSERLRLGYYPEKNVNFTKINNLAYNFEYKKEPNFTYSLIFRFNIDKI